MTDFTVYREGIVCCSVCTSLTIEEATARLKGHSGISSNWTLSEDKTFADGHPMPSPCEQAPETHKHYLFNC